MVNLWRVLHFHQNSWICIQYQPIMSANLVLAHMDETQILV